MALALVRCSSEADQGGTPHARARVSLVSWEGPGSHALLFVVPLGLPSARPMAQVLQLPFEYLLLLLTFISIIIIIIIHISFTEISILNVHTTVIYYPWTDCVKNLLYL